MELENLKYKIMSDQLKDDIKLSEKQNNAYALMTKGDNIFLTGSAGTGKCLGYDTPVIMYTGEIKMIQDIKVGDQIMGDDSKHRNVLSVTSGKDDMYKVSTENGDSYIVNSAHILTFQVSKTIKYKKDLCKYILEWGDISGKVKTKHFETKENANEYCKNFPILVNLPIMECIEANKKRSWKEYFKGVYKGIDFLEKNVVLDPYMLGLWLGNGSQDSSNEIIGYLQEYCNKNELRKKTDNMIRKYRLLNNKHIPLIYKSNSRNVRLQVLAGLLDSNGCLTSDYYEIIQKQKTLSYDIYFLAKSLGYQVSIKECEKVYRLFITGDISEIPVLLKRKKASSKKQINNHMVSSINIQSIGQDKYYGFELDGNHMFLLGNFLVTHNTSCIKMFINVYKQNKIMGITSTTGISALLFGGATLHSFLGIGLGNGSVESLYKKICTRPYIRNRWKDLEVLIIDEISMLSPELFDKLEALARRIRRNEKPFGGIQLILSGDFLQLPCVNSDNFCFESKSWDSCITNTIYLTEIMRQRDSEWQECLNNVRLGLLPKKTRKLLTSRVGKELTNEFGIKPTKLFSTNYSVDYVNNKELDILAEDDPDFYEYKMDVHVQPGVKNTDYVIEKYKKNCSAPDYIQLCVGAQVMLLWNYDTDGGLVNGSRGVVSSFVSDIPMVKFLNGRELLIDYHVWEIEENGKKILNVIQLPLKLAYALTIHRSQGCSLDYAEIDLSNTFANGQSYVALSRVKNIEGLCIIEIDFDKIIADKKAVAFYKDYT